MLQNSSGRTLSACQASRHLPAAAANFPSRNSAAASAAARSAAAGSATTSPAPNAPSAESAPHPSTSKRTARPTPTGYHGAPPARPRDPPAQMRYAIVLTALVGCASVSDPPGLSVPG